MRVKRIIALLLSYLPSALPKTDWALEQYINEVIALAGVPLNDSFRHAVATHIMHLDIKHKSVPKQYFVRLLSRDITNQAAYNLIYDLKQKKKAASEQLIQE